MSASQRSKTGRIRVIARTRPTANFAKDVLHLENDRKVNTIFFSKLHDDLYPMQTVSVHLPKNEDQLQGFINNQQQNWSFPLDKVIYEFT